MRNLSIPGVFVLLAAIAGSAAAQTSPPAPGSPARSSASDVAPPTTQSPFEIPTYTSNDWPTWGYDPERSGWNRGESTLSPKNVGKLRKVWTLKLPVEINKYVLSTLTSPVVAAEVDVHGTKRDIMFSLGANDTLFAIDANAGVLLWQKHFENSEKFKKPLDWLCPNTPNDTPTIDKARGIIFFIPSDGKLRGLDLATGDQKLTPVSTVAPFARAWSLNLVDSIIYTTSGRACGEVSDKRSTQYFAALSGLRRAGAGPLLDVSALNAVDVADLSDPKVVQFFTSGARPAAPWGRGGAVRGPGGMVLETSNGRFDPAAGDFSESVLKIAPLATRLMDSFTPKNWTDNQRHDMSGSASPVVFNFGGRTIIAASQKESVLRLLDAHNLGGPDHMTPLWESTKLGNDEKTGTDPSRGVWGAITTYEVNGRRFLYLPLYGHPSKEAPQFPIVNGPRENGSVMAFEVRKEGEQFSAVPAWVSADMVMPDPPVVANGVLFALSTGGQAMQNRYNSGEPKLPYDQSSVLRSTPVANMVLHAYDAVTGKNLWTSGNALTDWVHFSEPVVALGKVYVVTHDAQIVAFGLK